MSSVGKAARNKAWRHGTGGISWLSSVKGVAGGEGSGGIDGSWCC